MKLNQKTGANVVGCLMVDESMDMMALTKTGKMIRVDMHAISKSGRNTSGVYIVKGDEVGSISRCPKVEKDEDELLEDDTSADASNQDIASSESDSNENNE